MANPAPQSPLDSIPDPERIRDRLAELFAEAKLLRRLLRLSQAARHERRLYHSANELQEVAHAV
jgi:hypothetical protein